MTFHMKNAQCRGEYQCFHSVERELERIERIKNSEFFLAVVHHHGDPVCIADVQRDKRLKCGTHL